MRWQSCLVVFALACLAQASAQTPATGLAGRITSEGRGVPGAVVRVQRAGGDAATTLTTDAEGRYRASGLAQGVYRVDVSAPGYAAATRTGVVLFADQTVELDITLARVPALPPGAAAPEFTYADAWSLLAAGEVGVRLDTPLGAIFLAIDTVRAPVTAANFLKYVEGGFYNGGRFHRATRPDNYTPAPPNRPMMEIIQGGINPSRRGDAFPPIPLERTSVTGLKHVRGMVSMARGSPDTATSDFFILLDDQPSLDFGGRRFDDGQGGAAFGRVIVGLDVVRHIQQQPVQGQNLTPPVPIIRAVKNQ